MPIYEYRRADCGHDLEVMQKMSEDPLTDCPACSKPTLKKKISAVGFRLKGGGWYETDFKTGDKKKNLANKDDAPAKESSKSESAKKTDSSPTSDAKPAKPAKATPSTPA
ncbi:MAG: FmdB family zinc ribbon protein [Candidatus Competibacteraceae bacterium]|jgi:putative FmdB family regulatory protein|nr:FmdB family zinc ribbon protein [Candidatus Competibacteraceae bacterium]